MEQQQSWQIIAAAIKQAQATNSWKELGEQLSAARREYAQMIAERGVEMKEVKPSMLRRCYAHDYTQPGSYMITIVAANREAMPFGRVECPDGNPQNSRFVPSKVGEAMLECLKGISANYPMIEVRKAQLMPDHMHIILVVHAPIVSRNGVKTHIGNVIGGYKKGCNRAYWDLCSMGEPSNTNTSNTNPGVCSFPEQNKHIPEQNKHIPEQQKQLAEQQKHLPSNASSGRPPIWARGYTDTIITGKDHMTTEEAYLDDNPRRLVIKRLHKNLFRTIYHVRIGKYEYAAIGNVFLLRKAWKERVQFHHWEHLCPPGFQPCTKDWNCSHFFKVESDGSTSYYDSAGELSNTNPLNTNGAKLFSGANGAKQLSCATGAKQLSCANGAKQLSCANGAKQFSCANGVKQLSCANGVKQLSCAKSQADAHTERLLKAGDQGAVFASPFISEREKAVRNALLTMGCPYIRLTKEGFTDLYTPSKSEFYACAEGNLLILAPWGDRKRKTKITRTECKELNAQALYLCKNDLDMQIVRRDGFEEIIEIKED